jgi:hypothetical protein
MIADTSVRAAGSSLWYRRSPSLSSSGLRGTSDAARYFFFFGAGFAAFLGVLQAIGFLLMAANVSQRNRATLNFGPECRGCARGLVTRF